MDRLLPELEPEALAAGSGALASRRFATSATDEAAWIMAEEVFSAVHPGLLFSKFRTILGTPQSCWLFVLCFVSIEFHDTLASSRAYSLRKLLSLYREGLRRVRLRDPGELKRQSVSIADLYRQNLPPSHAGGRNVS